MTEEIGRHVVAVAAACCRIPGEEEEHTAGDHNNDRVFTSPGTSFPK